MKTSWKVEKRKRKINPKSKKKENQRKIFEKIYS